ncbi:MAG: galactose-1-epimerase, partial [Thermoanaerobaculia bacterium]|nr:galactose-1-epimerase [Thermoanaerobaculia bacterium]
RLRIAADRYTPTDDEMIPTGELAPVEGTPFDLREPQRLGDRLEELESFRARDPNGFDENFVLASESGESGLRLAAVLEDPASGRVLELATNQPGVQLYTGNFLSGLEGKRGAVYGKHQALCLETQVFPDSPNKADLEGWPSPVLRPGEEYRHVMVHRFSTAGH